MKTYQPKKNQIKREWHLIDAQGQVLGRLATQIARLLMGKGKPVFVPHLDCGDYVVVINVAHLTIIKKALLYKNLSRKSLNFPYFIKTNKLYPSILP